MAPETGTAVLILAAFVLPGFVTISIAERTYRIRGEASPFERLLQALYYSAQTYAILAAAAIIAGWSRSDIRDLLNREESAWKIAGIAILTIFVIPNIVAHTGRLWNKTGRLRPAVLKLLGISEAHSTPSAWDHFFSQGSSVLVRATLSDGRVVGGFYGSESFAGYSEQRQDLFLEQRWELDEDSWFVRPAQQSVGVWLAKESIVSLDIYTVSGNLTGAGDD